MGNRNRFRRLVGILGRFNKIGNNYNREIVSYKNKYNKKIYKYNNFLNYNHNHNKI